MESRDHNNDKATHNPRSRKGEYTQTHTKMFTAGNMTYMRKRKKERQAAKRAMARENVS